MNPWTRKIKRLLLSLFIWPMMGINRLIIGLVPFRRIAPRLGKQMVLVTEAPTKRQSVYINLIRKKIKTISRQTPWESKCYVQALTAVTLMRLFRIPYTLYLGMKRDAQDGQLKAHAWVMSGDCYVSGEGGRELFQVLAWFGRTGRSPAVP